MSKRYPRAKWELPEVVDPDTFRCYTIKVPDDRFHVAAFLGALQNLGSGQQWADDEEHTAKEVALVWRRVIDDMCQCESVSGNECCGSCKVANPPFIAELEFGTSTEFDLTIIAGQFNVIPVFLKPLMTVTISKVRGVWRDMQNATPGYSGWVTADGLPMEDTEADPLFVETDIQPLKPHMQLLARYDDGVETVYLSAAPTPPDYVPFTFQIPVGAPVDTLVHLFANGSVTEDGFYADFTHYYGQMCFHVKVDYAEALCAQDVITFDAGSGPYTVIIGTVVSGGPIGTDDSLLSSVFLGDVTARVHLPLETCTIHELFFMTYRDTPSDVQNMTITWTAKDENGDTIDSGLFVEDIPNGVIVGRANDFPNVPGVASLELLYNINTPGGGSPGFWIDDITVN